MVLTDDNRFPFSLFSESKGSKECETKKTGDVVTDGMDKTIGRAVVKIEGAISANNHIDFSGLQLTGNFICIQLCPLKRAKSCTTMHIELVTMQDVSLRLTISTLYDKDKPRFLGRSLRLPLPFRDNQGWTNLLLDVNHVLSTYCQSRSALKCINKIQLCSNMLVRDVVTSNVDFRSKACKELSVLPSASQLTTLDLSAPDYFLCPPSEAVPEPLPQPTSSPAALSSSPQQHKRQELRSPTYKQTNTLPLYTPPRTNAATPTIRSRTHSEPDTPDIIAMEISPPRTIGEDLQGSGLRSHRSAPTKSRLPQPKVVVPRRVGLTTTPPHATTRTAAASTAGAAHSRSRMTSTLSSTSNSAARVTPPSINASSFNTPVSERVLGIERVMGYTGGAAALLYNGGMIALASGVMIVLVDVRQREDEPAGVKPPKPNPSRYSSGLWKAFKSSTVTTGTENYPQAFLKAHHAPISLLVVSLDGRLMVSCESGVGALLILWDLQEGKRLAVLQPHAESVQSVDFSPESTMLCTSGWDHLRRIQVIVWDIPALVNASSGCGNVSKESSKGVVLARQLSDFHISKIVFSPFEEQSLVSCGRENIRFWRTRKGHLPGRPVQLGEYSRGYMFTDVAYVNAPALSEQSGSVNRVMGKSSGGGKVIARSNDGITGGLRPCVFVASSMGLLLRVDCVLEQVICAYQLHTGPIRAMSVNSAYAVTGGDDCKLRIWPLQFTDFLMEAHHEAAVTHVFVSQDAKLLTVGTSSGTLGILDVFDHRYWTVLRSHVGAVLSVCCRAPVGEEFLTVGRDNTIRLWDSLSGQQKFEFDSPLDSPLCGVYHPNEHVIACGFGSGALRVFDVETTSTLFERAPQPQHATPLVALQYSMCPNVNNSGRHSQSTLTAFLMLYTVSLEGRLTVYDVKDSYTPLRTLSVSALLDNVRVTGAVQSSPPADHNTHSTKDVALLQRRYAAVQLSTSCDGRLLAVSCGSLYSLCIFDTNEMVAVFKGASLFNQSTTGGVGAGALDSFGQTTSSMATTLASLPRAIDLGHGQATSPVNGLIFDKGDCDVTAGPQDSLVVHKLFVVTDKRIMCILISSPSLGEVDLLPTPPAILGASYEITPDNISSRRISVPVVPVPGAIAHDSSSGLFFIAAKKMKQEKSGYSAGSSKGVHDTSDQSGSGDNCLLVIGAGVRSVRDNRSRRVSDRVTLTCAQVMTDLPGDQSVLSISPCGSASNKVIMTDSGGCVSVWHMREDRIIRLKDQGTPVESEVYSPGEEDGEGDPNRSFGLHDLQLNNEMTALSTPMTAELPRSVMLSDEYGDGGGDSDKLQVSGDVSAGDRALKASDMGTFFNVMDDEEAGDDDVGSVGDVDDEPDASSTPYQSAVDEQLHSVSMLKKKSELVVKKDASLRVSTQLDDSSRRKQQKMPVSSSLSSSAAALDLNRSFGSDTEYVGQQMLEADFSTEHYSDDDSVVIGESAEGAMSTSGARTSAFRWLESVFGADVHHAMTGSAEKVRGDIILQRTSVPPCYSEMDKTVVTCNGTQISIESLRDRTDNDEGQHKDTEIGTSSSAHQLLIDPADGSKHSSDIDVDVRQVVRVTSFAPSGLFIAAVVDVFLIPLSSSFPEEGDGGRLEWKQAPSELHVWSRADCSLESSSAGATWQHLGEVTLYTTQPGMAPSVSHSATAASSSSLPATLSWTQDDSLLLLVSVDIPTSPPAQPAQSGALLSLTNWLDKIFSSSPSSLSSQHDVSSPYVHTPTPVIEMPGLPVILPFLGSPHGVKVLTDWQGPPCDLAMISYGDTKIAIYAVHVDSQDTLTPMWVKDIGRNGPMLSVHLADYSHVYTNCVNKTGRVSNDNVLTSVHRSGGRSVAETNIITEHKRMESKADYQLMQSGVKNASVINSAKRQTETGRLKAPISSVDRTSGAACGCCDIIFRSYPLLLTLDNAGAIHCSRLTFSSDFTANSSGAQAQTPASCVARVSLAHVSGSPRTMTVSPCASALILASTNCIQIFSLSVRDVPSTPFAVSLTLRQKVVVPFSLDYIVYMPHPSSRTAPVVIEGEPSSRQNKHLSQASVLCSAKSGSMSVVTVRLVEARAAVKGTVRTAKSGPVKKAGATVTAVRAAPPFSRVDTIVSLNAGRGNSKIALLNQHSGEVALVSGTTGKPVLSRLSGFHSSYSMACCDAFMAIGSRCGRVSVYLNNSTMDLGQVVVLNSGIAGGKVGKVGGNSALTSSKATKKSSELFSNVTIKHLSVVSSGRTIVALRMDNTLFVIRLSLQTKNMSTPKGNSGGQFSPYANGGVQIVSSVKCQISVPLCLHTAPASVSASECTLMKHEYYFAPCFGDDHLFVCIRGHSLHLYSIHDTSHHHRRQDDSSGSSGRGCGGKLPSSHLRPVRVASYRLTLSAKDLIPASYEHEHGDDDDDDDGGDDDGGGVKCDLRVQARGVHVVRLSGSTLQLSVIGVVEQSTVPVHFMFAGKVDMSEVSGDGHSRGDVVEGDIKLYPCFSLGKVSSVCTSDSDYLGVVGHDGVKVYDVCSLHVATRKILSVGVNGKNDAAGSRRAARNGGGARVFNNKLFEVSTCKGVFQNTLQSAASISSHTWSRAVISLSRNTGGGGGGRCDEGCMAFVHSTQSHSPVMYRILFK